MAKAMLTETIIDGKNQKLERKLSQNNLNFCMLELQSRIAFLWLRVELMLFDLVSYTATAIN
jgi:hypothetical protein